MLALSAGCAAAPPPEEAPDGGLAGSAAEAGDNAAAGAGNGAAAADAAGSSGEPGAGSGASDDGPSDEIYGVQVPRSQSYWAGEGRIWRGSEEVRLVGLNWFGLETDTLALFGPIEARRGVHEFVRQVQGLGFNALRIPVAPESIQPGFATAGWAVRGELDTGRAHLDEVLEAAARDQMLVLLDFHTCAVSGGYRAGRPDDPSCGGYSVDDWLLDLEQLADLAQAYSPTVIGVDLFNEPHALDWESWRSLAEQGGEAVLRRNPNILVFVGGIASVGYAGSDSPFWGENLTLAGSQPVDLPPSRLVLSPHVYGPSVSAQRYFAEAAFPGNMPGIWDEHFGYLYTESSQPTVIPGEFGGRYEGDDKLWQDALVDYLLERGAPGFFYWALNPNSGDTGGLLLDDWRSVNEDKLALLERLMP